MEILISVILSILTTVAVIACSWGKLKQGFDDLKERFDKFEAEIRNDFKECIKDISGIKRGMAGEGHSPFRLKERYKKIVLESNIDEQIKQKEQRIIDLIQSKNPPNPLDAQSIIDENVSEIMSWLDLTDLKNKMYEGGLSTGIEKTLIAIYLYEIIIPKLKF